MTVSRLTGLARLRPRTLRAKLTCGLVVLLALSCAAVGLTAVLALRGFLTGQLDHQLADSGCRFPDSMQRSAADGQHTADTRGQSVDTFGADLLDGVVTSAAVVRVQGSIGVTLDAADRAALAGLPVDGHAHTISLSALGDYRVYACEGRQNDVLVAGQPLAPMNATVGEVTMVAFIVFGAALVVTGAAGAAWVRRSLRPLRQVTATAADVTALRLDTGEVVLPGPVGAGDPRSEAGQVAAALNRMLGHVQDALAKRHASEQRLRTFAADASHELRTPVASIRGHAELALRHPDPIPQKVERALRRVAAESTRMTAIVDDLLLLARLDAGRPLEHDQVDLTHLVLDCTDDARVAGQEHTWVLDLPESPVAVAGDGPRLAQVVNNLLANAHQHTPPGTTVTVRLEQRADNVCALTVSDDGPGIPREIQDTVFERFTRAGGRHRGARRGTGTGLGLSIAAAIVGAHDGSLSVVSSPGSTTFTVLVPG